MPKVFISSTSLDLPEHRGKIIEACLELGLHPDGMEHFSAVDATALQLCLNKVEQCDLFVGVYAHRYGWVPPGQSKSITELEYDHAVAQNKPRYLFAMGADHPIKARDKDSGPSLEALERFKARVGSERVWKTFDSPDQLKAAVLAALHAAAASAGSSVAPAGATAVPRVDLSHLPGGAPHFLGRQTELAALDAAWEETGRTHVLQLIAPGGTGKTSLMTRWVDSLRAAGWRGAQQVFGWSFYSQGSGEDRQASEDGFLDAASTFFGVSVAPAASPWDKGAKLADAVAARRNLLILDGLEPLQHPPGHTLAGELKAPGLQTLLKQLAARGQPGLVLITSRESLTDLADRLRDAERPDAGVVLLDLGNLMDADGARLLYKLGVTRAGAAAIAKDSASQDAELQAASRDVAGHALTLSLLGSYLARAWGGDVRKRDIVDFARADEKTNRGHAFRAMAAYASWLAGAGEACARELAALRLVGFFDRPASRANLAALRAAPAIAGLTEALVSLDEADWNCTLANLAQAGLLRFDADSGSLDAHPLVREYIALRLEKDQIEAWREGHRRVYVQIKTDTPQRPDGLAGLQPLYQAVAHGCKAGRYQEALYEVYADRILRGTGHGGFYSTDKLGAFGADLGAVACFFVEPWRRPAPQLQEADQAWLLNAAAIRLRALGRLAEALEPMRAGAEMRVRGEHWKNAAASYGNLSELQLTLGHIAAAVQDAARAVEYADRCGDAFFRMAMRTTLADARQQQGETGQAQEGYTAAEALQVERQPQYPLLYSLQGFQYCELLLAPMERAAWRGGGDEAALQACAEVARRAAQTLPIAEGDNWLLDIALDHLTLARCALYTDLLQNRPPGDDARREIEAAVSGLRAAGTQDHLPRGLLTRAWLRHACGDLDGCRADLQEIETIASRGGMKLFLADLALTHARLFRDRTQLQLARELITECGYGRRLPELQDAETLAASWPDVNSAPPSNRLADSTPEASVPSPAAENPAKPPKPARPRKSRKPAMPPANIDFLIVTPLQEERDAVLARLPANRKLPPTADDIRVYYAAEIAARFPDGSPVRYATVLLPLGGMGHTEAATATADAIRRWNPRYVLLAGIAGGIAAAGVNVGDVLIADQIADYELAKVLPSGPQIRWQTHTVDRRLLIAAQNFDGGDFRSTQAARFDDAEPAVHFGPICTGNKVLADDSLAQQLREVWVKMIGVEMEAAGVANAASQSARQPGFFMVRGVSDLADSSKDSNDVKRWRPYACEIAAAWAIEFLKSGPVPAVEPAATRQALPAAAPPPVPKGKRGAGTAPNASSKAVAVWHEKLEFLREQQASCADPAQLFSIKKQIEEAEAKIRELS